jgi:hypothetical protein
MEKTGRPCGHRSEDYRIFDPRLNKPVCLQTADGGPEKGSMITQELDEIHLAGATLRYFSPNTIGLLLSISAKQTENAKKIFPAAAGPRPENRASAVPADDKNEFLIATSQAVADFVEMVQAAILTGYAAIQTFANMSIPENYEYRVTLPAQKIIKSYNKESIGRWISLHEKLSKILPHIYDAKGIAEESFWPHFLDLEKRRNEILFQKSIHHTEIYQAYFQPGIFTACSCPEHILKFFFNAHPEKQAVNPLWPWVINPEKKFPVRTDLSPGNQA